jgi:hypothetical protein
LLGIMAASTLPVQYLMANTLRLLLSDDEFAGDVVGGSMQVEDALQHVLWTDPPMANFGITYPPQDTTIAGTVLPAYQPVVISFAAANNDPTFHQGDDSQGNRAHLAWSAGPHACPAKRQAVKIASLALETLLDQVPDMRIAVSAEQLPWMPGAFHRALAALPVTFSPEPLADRPTAITGGASPWPQTQPPSITPPSPTAQYTAPAPHPYASTSPAMTSMPNQAASATKARRRWWSFLEGLWRGR